MSRLRKVLWIAPVVVCLAAPGWEGRLSTVPHEHLLRDVRKRNSLTSVSLPGEREGEMWHLSYIDNGGANLLGSVGLRRQTPSLLPADYVAHIPVGSVRADGYYRVETSARWPWWWPGGGMDWTLPDR